MWSSARAKLLVIAYVVFLDFLHVNDLVAQNRRKDVRRLPKAPVLWRMNFVESCNEPHS